MSILARSGSRQTSTPPMKAAPAEGRSRPTNILMVVDLPAPFGPRNPKNSPRRTARLRPLTAIFWPNALVRPHVAIAASGGGKGAPQGVEAGKPAADEMGYVTCLSLWPAVN